MDPNLFYIAEGNPALRFASEYLAEQGCRIADTPGKSVTHLLLPVPCPAGSDLWRELASQLSEDVTVLGGNLTETIPSGYKKADLLKDEIYLAKNAAITADCAVRLAGSHLTTTFRNCPILVLGWGRIGKCLAGMLAALGAEVTVAARKESDRAMAQALGYGSTGFDGDLSRYRILFNTAPAPVLSENRLRTCRQDCIRIDLASKKGMEGKDVIWARGLPGKMLPESSGRLIGETVLRLTGKEAVL